MDVAVIGAGPAGLAAAHAATGQGASVVIYAPKRKTPQNGPLLMQRPIPGVNQGHPDGTIQQIVINGTILGYRYKLYGDINIGINGDQLKPSYHAWRHKETYGTLWNMYHGLIEDRMVLPQELMHMDNEFDLVVCTANIQNLCLSRNSGLQAYQHHFNFKAVAVTNRAEYPDQPYNTIIFNAGENDLWVRSSNVFGVTCTEWPLEHAPAGSRIIQKPISTDCNCFSRVLRTGRFGRFENEVWVDTAYYDVWGALESMKRQGELDHIK
jgi:hypothetical protein